MLRRCIGLFFRLVSVTEYLIPDDSLRSLIQVFLECLRNLLILGPQRSVDKRLGRSHHDRRIPLAWIAIGPQSVAAAEREKKPATPAVWQTKNHLDGAFHAFGRAQRRTDTVERCSSGITLPCRCRPLEQGRNLAEFLAKFVLSGQRSGPSGSGCGKSLPDLQCNLGWLLPICNDTGPFFVSYPTGHAQILVDELFGLLTGQSVLVFPCRRKRHSNAIASFFAPCDPTRPDVNCGSRLGRIPESPTMDPKHPRPIVDSVAASVWWHSRETQRDHTRTAKDEHTYPS